MKITAVIPVFNNPRTVLSVALDCKKYIDDVLVVDDASTLLPDNFDATLQQNSIKLIRHTTNQGKGAAILTALSSTNADYIITIDADGQHSPSNLPDFINAINHVGQNCDTIFIGCRDFNTDNVPGSSKFGRAFSNFWVKLESGTTCTDTQSGYRAYPVTPLRKLHFLCARYNFEIEILVRAIWGGLHVSEVPISVTYPPAEERISHFKPFKDNARLSLLHTWLVTRRILPFPHKRLIPKPPTTIPSFLKSPRAFFKYLLHENASPELLAASAGISSFLAVLPLLSCHMAVILYVCIRLKLNKVMALAIQNLYMPPFTPFLCIELGYFMRHGHFLTEASWQTIGNEFALRLYEWLLGSLIIAPIAAILSATITYFIAHIIHKKTTNNP